MDKRSTALYVFPLIVCALLYWGIWDSWFFQDDFSWLHLNHELAGSNLWTVLTRPMAQGTWRPLSERAQFMLLPALFGLLDATSHHALAFVTQFLNLLLLNNIVRKLTGSQWAGFAAALLWTVNAALALPMGWPAAYSQILCSTFLLAALWLWIRYTETGERRFLIGQWIVFLLGFMVQELNVVYPAIALCHALLFAPSYWKKTIKLFVVSAAYAIGHNQFAPKGSEGVYGLDVGSSVFSTLAQYCTMAIAPIPAIAMIGLLVWAIVRRDKAVLFGFGWFVIVLSPFLLLPKHVADYYLSVPTAGIGIAFGCELTSLWKKPWWMRIIALALLTIYAVGSAKLAYSMTKSNRDASNHVKSLVLGVQQISQRNQGKTILLDGITDNLFMDGLYHHPFGLVGAEHVYLTEENAARLTPFREHKDFSQFVLAGLANDSVVVYRFENDRLRNVTAAYQSTHVVVMPKKVLLGMPAFTYLLGPEWYAAEDGYRWMPQSASLTIAGGEKLIVRGFCAPAQLKNGPIRLTLEVNKVTLKETQITDCDRPFERSFPLTNQPELHVIIRVDRTMQIPPDARQLGIAIEEVRVP